MSYLQSWNLVRAVARVAAGVAPAEQVARAAEHITAWPQATALMNEQGLLPWLARSIGSSGTDDLQQRAATGAARTLAQVAILVSITREFERDGIVSLPYKGPLLSLQLYGDLALRQSTDLDLVVNRGDFERARQVLLRLGLPSRHGHTLQRERALFEWLGHASFGTGADFVELHWRLAPRQFPFSLSAADAIARATRLSAAGMEFTVLADDDLAVTLAMHGARHLFERLEWLSGFWRLVRAHPMPDALLDHATRLGARRMLLVSVALAGDMLEEELHPFWRQTLERDSSATRRAMRIGGYMIEHALEGTPFPDGAPLQREYAGLIDSPVNRVRSAVLAALLPTEREWELVQLPDVLLPLYRVVRPIRLAGLYMRRIFHAGVTLA